jgi:hypothetical protein
MNRFLPFFALAALVVAACDNTPTEPLTAENSAVAMFDEAVTGEPLGVQNAVTPSTNEINEAHVPQWAHVIYVDVVVGQVTLDFVAPRGFYSCFEYRIDLAAAPTSDPNYNPGITDGLWPFTCPGGASGNSTEQMILTADEYVDVRMVFGGETDERFAWTRFYVLTPPNRDDCKHGDWQALGFRNQGQCVRWVETGKDSRVGD